MKIKKNRLNKVEKLFFKMIDDITDLLKCKSVYFWIDGINHDFIINSEDIFINNDLNRLGYPDEIYKIGNAISDLERIKSSFEFIVDKSPFDILIKYLVEEQQKIISSSSYAEAIKLTNIIDSELNEADVSLRKSLYKRLVDSDYGVQNTAFVKISGDESDVIQFLGK